MQLIHDIRPDDFHIAIDKHGHATISFVKNGQVLHQEEMPLDIAKQLAAKMGVALMLNPPAKRQSEESHEAA